ncbi:formimidoylglutamate deiminase [Nocardioides daeguensis]|uniref:Formimidoylglutamate deiminase n=1 Tax=Nocardioides daeguensis TaxID=908359 RepID=A0ABP6VW10_9ACTN|nr:formimidoylglutamate deiminase [Nocardioides daeguensis]MBV6726910.1 formimidoylglutamate deiminase [Nocardioides daeguensis]MCR1772909.1 formimidoylglutamate deiminase [Nocardioides daeguensis]
MSAYLLEHAWVGGRVQDTVRVEVEHGRITSVEADATRTGVPLRGLTLPGFANTHSHAFHRALRGRTQADRGTFWTWREQMYAVAGQLDPDTYYELARATYAEMVAAGYTSVGEFHYLHHQPDGTPYDDPNAMGNALLAAARDAGIRITLLDTLYLSSGFGAAPEGVQRRFSDGSAEAWQERVAGLAPLTGADSLIGVAAHSVRAVPADSLKGFAPYVEEGVPVHVHLSEQVEENAACVAAHGVTPTRLLADHGVLGPTTSAVHATHLTDEDIRLLGEARVFASFCPTTERDLGDGIGPARALQQAGSILTLGSDSHAVIDAFEEMRAVEMDERLASRTRGHWTAAELLLAGTADGHRSLGFADAGEIAVGQRADLVTVDLASPRTAGTGGDEHTAVFAASGADVTHVIVDGTVVFDGDHDRVGRSLVDAIGKVWSR